MENPEDTQFDRDIWCLLGLPFDAVSVQGAAQKIGHAISANNQCFFSTPNLNFTIAALNDPAFRNSVINSELSLMDGMPLLWIARLLGSGLRQKASGSDVFNQLWRPSSPLTARLKVFFFGGKAGIAELACQKINDTDSSMTCAGFLNPGFGSIEEISRAEFIAQINESMADFLVVALGARKGQLWIDQNRDRLQIPVVSHLGAVVNFVAGNVKRAPVWMQRSGLEWVWRVMQEPSLWRRYFFDGLYFIKLIATRVFPYLLWRNLHASRLTTTEPVTCRIDIENEWIVISIKGSCLHSTIDPLRDVFRKVSSKGEPIRLNLAEVPVVDTAFLGLCLVLLKQLKRNNGELSITGLNRDVRRIFYWNCVEYLQ